MANTSYLDTNLKLREVEYSHQCMIYKSLRLFFSRYEAPNEDSPKRSVLLLQPSTEIIHYDCGQGADIVKGAWHTHSQMN